MVAAPPVVRRTRSATLPADARAPTPLEPKTSLLTNPPPGDSPVSRVSISKVMNCGTWPTVMQPRSAPLPLLHEVTVLHEITDKIADDKPAEKQSQLQQSG